MSTEPTPTTPGFEALGLKPELLSTIAALGYTQPTPVQQAAIPPALEGRDVLGQAATGTGKTAAFALPMLNRMEPGRSKPNSPTGLVVVPTRELAMQVAETIHKYGSSMGFTALAIYGGQEMYRQIRPLSRGVDIVVATPGRALDHIRRKTLKLDRVQTVVLDEADEMLDLGFADDLDELLSTLPESRQTALFSATLPSRIAKIAETHLKDPVRVRIETQKALAGSTPKIRQSIYLVPQSYKDAAFARLLDAERPVSAIVFCRTREEVERVGELVGQLGLAGAALHGGMSQEQRDRVLKRFKSQSAAILIATDVAARGLDVQHVSHVFNYDVPNSSEVYVHRIGRTGRAGREGRALTLLEPRQRRMLQGLERASGQKIEILPVPSVEQVRQLKITRLVSQVEAALGDEVDPVFGKALEALVEKHSAPAVAAATLEAMYEALNPGNDAAQAEIPAFSANPRTERNDRGPRSESRGDSRSGPRGESRGDSRGAPRFGERSGGPAGRGPRSGGDMTRFVVRLGARAGVRPQDLVGAIANEAEIPSRDIGGIVIQDGLSFVEVASRHAAKVAVVMKSTSLRGRKASFELDRSASGPRPDAASGDFAPPAREPRAPRSSTPRAPRQSAPKTPRQSAPKQARQSAPRGPRPSATGVGQFVIEAIPEKAAPSSAQGDQAPAQAPRRFEKPAFQKQGSFQKPGFQKSGSFQKPSFGNKPFNKSRSGPSQGHTPRSFTEKNPAQAARAYMQSAEAAKAKADRLMERLEAPRGVGAFGQKRFGEKKVFGTPGGRKPKP